MAASVIRVLKEIDVAKVDKNEERRNARSWMMFDPIAAEARFPGISFVV